MSVFGFKTPMPYPFGSERFQEARPLVFAIAAGLVA
jgi:hypothetical protein